MIWFKSFFVGLLFVIFTISAASLVAIGLLLQGFDVETRHMALINLIVWIWFILWFMKPGARIPRRMPSAERQRRIIVLAPALLGYALFRFLFASEEIFTIGLIVSATLASYSFLVHRTRMRMS